MARLEFLKRVQYRGKSKDGETWEIQTDPGDAPGIDWSDADVANLTASGSARVVTDPNLPSCLHASLGRHLVDKEGVERFPSHRWSGKHAFEVGRRIGRNMGQAWPTRKMCRRGPSGAENVCLDEFEKLWSGGPSAVDSWLQAHLPSEFRIVASKSWESFVSGVCEGRRIVQKNVEAQNAPRKPAMSDRESLKALQDRLSTLEKNERRRRLN